jgi:hypothetical protein
VYEIAGESAIVCRRLTYPASGGVALECDLYERPGRREIPRPAVLFVTGYDDRGMERIVGCKAKDMACYESWGRLVAASGMVGVTYECREPAGDAKAILGHMRANAPALGIDPARLAVWSCSGNVPNALSLLMDSLDTACAALCYGYMLDVDGATHVVEAAQAFRFANSAAGRSVRDLPANLPLLVVRAGRDEMPGLNDSIDGFVHHSLEANRPVTVINHHTGPHAFDIMDDSGASRAAVRDVLQYLTVHLDA